MRDVYLCKRRKNKQWGLRVVDPVRSLLYFFFLNTNTSVELFSVFDGN